MSEYNSDMLLADIARDSKKYGLPPEVVWGVYRLSWDDRARKDIARAIECVSVSLDDMGASICGLERQLERIADSK